MKIFWGLLLIFFVSACGSTYSEEDRKNFDKEIQTYLDEHKIECEKSPTGLYYRIDSLGSDRKIQFSDRVTMKYVGKLINGKIIDDHSNEPITMSVRELIAAWKEILLELGEGGKAFIVAPPHLAYGDYKLDSIPENSILIYNLEVVDVE
ncbi:MAG: hypothetical protein A3D92_10155 [Bacteroidetes bacterium RIFCSPHIGHO2_02_FULL_44_7]|nr:MAG: hypothetical protein A3D92_10155 [Bacteroidetes bacterium RIFCSPHIGHO2_02_FULL_44_7]